MLHAILFWLFVLSIAVQCGYALYFFTRIFNLQKHPLNKQPAKTPVSVIICAKNEARNLELYLPAILAQRYMNEAGKPMYEVIVVNDVSEDDTEQVLYRLEQQYSHLWHVTVTKEQPREFKGKKFALGIGVSYASHPLLLLTDADCTPASENWLAYMVQPLENGKEVSAGYGGYIHKPGMLNAFIRWETMHTFLQYSTYALAGKPYMAVGRNLACTKHIFAQAQQSGVWNQLPSGDDDLLMNTCATAENTAIVAHPDSYTVSEPKYTWSDWLHQKQRHISAGKFYKDDTKAILAGYAVSHALCWLLFLVLLLYTDWMLIFMVMAMRCAMYWTIWETTAFKIRDKRLLMWIPLCDIGWAVYNFVLSPYIIWKNKQQWK